MNNQNWYNAERVSQSGSVILNEWRAARQQVRAAAENEATTGLSSDGLAQLLSIGGPAGEPAVTESSAMRVSAVYACVALIAGAISTLPLQIYERTETGRKKVHHDYWWFLNEQPNEEISAAVFWEYMIAARLFHGDCFAEILRPSNKTNRASGLRPLHPQRVQPFRDSDRRLFYRVTSETGTQYTLHPSDMIHVPSLGYDGLRSPSPITYAARQAISTALAAGRFNSAFFSNGARPDFALKTPGKLNDDQVRVLRETWSSRHSGVANAHLPAVLTGGLEVQQLTMKAEDSQIIATELLSIEDIARALGVPPYLIGHLTKVSSWGSGVEQLGRGFVKFTLRRDLTKIAQEFNRKLWPTRERFFVEHDVSDLERGDLKSENEAFRIALGRAGEPGWMTPNEVRNVKLLPPIKGGDKLNDGAGKPAAGADDKPTETDPSNDQAPEPAVDES